MSLKEDIISRFPELAQRFHDDWNNFAPTRSDEYRIEFEVSKKWTKIVLTKYGNSRSVNGFVCMEDNGVFKAGDLLKAASWKAPAKNFARGTIFDLDNAAKKHIRWTGIA